MSSLAKLARDVNRPVGVIGGRTDGRVRRLECYPPKCFDEILMATDEELGREIAQDLQFEIFTLANMEEFVRLKHQKDLMQG